MYLLLFFMYTLSYCPVAEFDINDYAISKSNTSQHVEDPYGSNFEGKWLGLTTSPKAPEKNHELKKIHVVATNLLRQSTDKTNS